MNNQSSSSLFISSSIASRIRLPEIALWGYLTLIATLILSLIFYRERLDKDAAWYLTNLVQNEWFAFEHHRPASVFNQWLAVILAKKHAPIDTVLYAFNLTDWFHYFLFFNITLWGFRDAKAAAAIGLLALSGVVQNFFNPVSELTIAAPVLISIYAALRTPAFSVFKIVYAALFIPILAYSHPLYYVLLPAVFLLLFAERKQKATIQLIGLGAVALVSILIAKFGADAYDSHVMKGAQSDMLEKISRIHPLRLLRFGLENYWPQMLFVVLTFAALWLDRKMVIIKYYAFCVFGFFAIFLAIYGNIDEHSPYNLERYGFPLTFLAFLGFCCYYFQPNRKWRNIFGALVLLVCGVFSVAKINNYGHKLAQRTNQLDAVCALIARYPEQKFVLRSDNFGQNDHGGLYFYFHNEVMLQTAKLGANRVKQILAESVFDERIKTLKPETYFLAEWSKLPAASFNPNYFRFQPSNIRYLNTDDTTLAFRLPEFYQKISMNIELPQKISRYNRQTLPIEIRSEIGQTIASGLKGGGGVWLTFFWKNKEGEITMQEERTPFLADFDASLKQIVALKAPSKSGEYQLDLDLTNLQGQRLNCRGKSIQVAVR